MILIKEEGQLVLVKSIYEGAVEIDGVEIDYLYTEDDNGSYLEIMSGGEYVPMDHTNDAHVRLAEAISMWGTPDEMGSVGQIVDTAGGF